jgi:IS4 transposase
MYKEWWRFATVNEKVVMDMSQVCEKVATDIIRGIESTRRKEVGLHPGPKTK